MKGPTQFCFLNQDGDLVELGWDNPSVEKLWRYNLHYFDDLNAEGAESRRHWHSNLLQEWISSNLFRKGTAWEPYPTSLRIVNWIKWRLAGNELSGNCIESLAKQVRWLDKRIEWHLLGNHLFANAKALVFAGLAFKGDESQKWFSRGVGIIESQLAEQILADGGHFERSPMYHAIFLEDMLDLINITTAFPNKVSSSIVQYWRERAACMITWLVKMSHPDGEISLFNDAAFGIASSPGTLVAYCKRLGVGESIEAIRSECRLELSNLSESGYVRIGDPNSVAILDVAPVGPDYLPAHAHADTLSFELSVFGRRVIVNGGTSRYGTGPVRLQERGTEAHSTVTIDGMNSSEIWDGFRVARRAYPFDLELHQTDEEITVLCSHDGYRRLPGRAVHRREWRLSRGRLLVQDQVSGKHESAVARYILHPDVRFMQATEGLLRLEIPGRPSLSFRVVVGKSHLQGARYSPEFGVVIATTCIVVELIDGVACIAVEWS